MMKILKVLNPFIWLFNFFNYMAHLQHYSGVEQRGGKYEDYDFNRDAKYF